MSSPSTPSTPSVRASGDLRLGPSGPWRAVHHHVLGGLCLADEGAVDLLRRLEVPHARAELLRATPGLAPERLDAFLAFFEARKLLVVGSSEDSAAIERRRRRAQDAAAGRLVRVVQLIVTNRCNFRCEYCFERRGRPDLAPGPEGAARAPPPEAMSPRDAITYLERAIALARRAGTAALAVQFFGGEPALRSDVVAGVLARFGRGDADGIALSYSIVTNGSLVDGALASTFRRHDVAVMVSYDSPHSDRRLLAGGGNCHGPVERGLAALRAQGARTALNAVLGEGTFEEFDERLVDFCFTHGIYEIGVLLDLDPAFYRRRPAKEIVDRLWKVYEQGRRKGVTVGGYWHQIHDQMVAIDRYAATGFENCSALGAQLSIEPGGAVFACKASSACFGTILDPDALLGSEAYRRYAERACAAPAPCAGCALEHFCAGLCIGSVEAAFGDIDQVEQAACEVYREITARLTARAIAGGALPRFKL